MNQPTFKIQPTATLINNKSHVFNKQQNDNIFKDYQKTNMHMNNTQNFNHTANISQLKIAAQPIFDINQPSLQLNNLSSETNPPPQQLNQPTIVHKHDHKHAHHHHSIFKINFTYIVTIIAMLLVSFLFVYQFLIITKQPCSILIIIIFSLLLFMVIWSFISTSCSDPGKVPFYYGLSPQINFKSISRKYCLICQNFKPQRTHHCSVCKKCILNMDHHCPWVNNCIGFKNRKYFILFLIYLCIGLVFVSIIQLITMIDEFKKIIETQVTDIHFALKLIQCMITMTFSVILIIFLSHHIIMIKNNTTSLQQFSRIHSTKQKLPKLQQANTNYNVSHVQNMLQVFGENKLYWGLPIYGAGPKGSGTLWPKVSNNNNIISQQIK